MDLGPNGKMRSRLSMLEDFGGGQRATRTNDDELSLDECQVALG